MQIKERGLCFVYFRLKKKCFFNIFNAVNFIYSKMTEL